MAAKKYDRKNEDVGNIIGLEHMNVLIGDQIKATLFYVKALGFTRDPFMMTNADNMWINLGRSQFHLPTGKPQVLRGRTGLVVSSHEKLLERLKSTRQDLRGTKFRYSSDKKRKVIDVVCPWGNRFRCHEAGAFGKMRVGMPYIQFDVRVGTAGGIAGFYREIMRAPSRVGRWDGARAALVQVGVNQNLIFREKRGPEAKFDGHHIQIYVVDFSGPYNRLLDRGLVSQESNQYQYRFVDITDLKSGELLFKIDHEVRAMSHPLYGRFFVNRNPDQHIRSFVEGYEQGAWLMPAQA